MSHDLTCVHGPLSLSIEFTAAERAGDTVQVNISVSQLGTNERLEWAVYEVWVADEALARFEAQLASTEDAVLTDTRGEALLRVIDGAGSAALDLGCRPSDDGGRTGRVFASISTPPGLKPVMQRAFLDYAKWW